MNPYLCRVVFTILIVTVGGQASAMLTHIETKKPHKTSVCKNVMALLSACCEAIFPSDPKPYHTVDQAMEAFRNKSVEKGAVIICNIDTMLDDDDAPLRDELTTLFPFFYNRGYAFIFATTVPECSKDIAMKRLFALGYSKDEFTLCCMPTARCKLMHQCSDTDKQQIIISHFAYIRDLFITEGHSIAASIDTNAIYLAERNAGYQILVSADGVDNED